MIKFKTTKMSTETKDKTPIQKAIDEVHGSLQLEPTPKQIIRYLESLLPYEKQWAEEIFEVGSNWYEDNEDRFKFGEHIIPVDFEKIYSKYEK